jgi:hypothetical protein
MNLQYGKEMSLPIFRNHLQGLIKPKQPQDRQPLGQDFK